MSKKLHAMLFWITSALQLTSVRTPHMTRVASTSSNTIFGASSALHAILGSNIWTPRWQPSNAAGVNQIGTVVDTGCNLLGAMNYLQVPLAVIPFQTGNLAARVY